MHIFPRDDSGQFLNRFTVIVLGGNLNIGDLSARRVFHGIDVTYEFENIDYEALNWLKEHAYLPQGSELLLITQNRGLSFFLNDKLAFAVISAAACFQHRREPQCLNGFLKLPSAVYDPIRSDLTVKRLRC
jgi:hypothetical protein